MGYVVQDLGIVDMATGELVSSKVVFFGKKPTMTDNNYVKVFVAFLEDLVMDSDITGKAIRLLLYAVHNVDWNNLHVYLYYKDVVEKLNINKDTYFKWLKQLIDKGYIEPTKYKYFYKLKPYSFVKGSMSKVESVEA